MSLRNSAILLLLGFVIGGGAAIVSAPLYRSAVMAFHQDSYGELVFACDDAMREHFLSKAQLSRSPSGAAVRALDATQIGLLDCHRYDLQRKTLLRWGLDENDLSTMELRAIEERAIDLHRVIEIHEIRY